MNKGSSELLDQIQQCKRQLRSGSGQVLSQVPELVKKAVMLASETPEFQTLADEAANLVREAITAAEHKRGGAGWGHQ